MGNGMSLESTISAPVSARHLIRRLLPLIVVAFLMGVALKLGLIATSSGPGITADSSNYLCAAENLVEGRGLRQAYTVFADPNDYGIFHMWPPLYPLTIAVLVRFGLDSTAGARYISVTSFALLMLPLLWYARRHAVAWPACWLLGWLCAVSPPLLEWASWALSEALFTLFSISCVVTLAAYLAAPPGRRLGLILLSALLMSLAMLTRWMGWVLLVTGWVIIAARGDGLPRSDKLKHALIVMASILPLLLWGVRNSQLGVGLVGFGFTGIAFDRLAANLSLLPLTIIQDLLPRPALGLGVPGRIGLVLLAVALAWFVVGRFALLHRVLRQHPVVVAYIATGSTGLVIATSFFLGPIPINSRYVAPFIPALLLLGVIVFDRFLESARAQSEWRFTVLLVVAMAVYVVFSTSAAWHKATESAKGQWFASNIYRENRVFPWLQHNVGPEDRIYSNMAEVVWYYTHHPVKALPDFSNAQELMVMLTTMQHSDGDSYVVVFEDLWNPMPGWQAFLVGQAAIAFPYVPGYQVYVYAVPKELPSHLLEAAQ